MTGPELLVATTNAGKLAEFRAILRELPVSWRSLADVAPVDFPEEGEDYGENAVAKARVAARATGLIAVADDSGIEVAALDGRPGPRSARYGGPELDDRGRVARLLGELEGVADGDRAARFVCHAAWATPGGDAGTSLGICKGTIGHAPRGEGGFGYDPIFHPGGGERSMAELAEPEKNRISHRGCALAALEPSLREALGIA